MDKIILNLESVFDKKSLYDLINNNIDTNYEIKNLDALFDFLGESFDKHFILENVGWFLDNFHDREYAQKFLKTFFDAEIYLDDVHVSIIDISC